MATESFGCVRRPHRPLLQRVESTVLRAACRRTRAVTRKKREAAKASPGVARCSDEVYCTVSVTSSSRKSVLPLDELSVPVNLIVTVWPIQAVMSAV